MKRILATLQGVACGDAIGKQTEGLSRDDVRRWYPAGVRGFEGTPGAVIPRYVGNRKREWRIGETTDDTERTIAVARAILADGGDVRHTTVGRELLACVKCVHPGIASLWEFHQAGDPARVAQRHDGCGAAIRMTPVGILYRSDHFDAIVAASRAASISTHGGPLALAAAAATAVAVSAAIDGAEPDDIFALACRAAAHAEFADALRRVRDDVSRRSETRVPYPNDPLTVVPLALALATTMDSAADAILLATNIGGDSDSVASIAGAILGARHPHTVPDEWVAIVEAINGHGLIALAHSLRALRR
jgi:ADP-ribosylglycohydrolase